MIGLTQSKTPSAGVLLNNPSSGVMHGGGRTRLQRLTELGTLDFFKDFSSTSSLTADYSKPLDLTANVTLVNVTTSGIAISTTENASGDTGIEYFVDNRQCLIRQNGTISSCDIYIGASAPSDLRIRIWRENKVTPTFGANTFVLVGSSGNIAGSVSTSTTNLAVPFVTPITGVQVGDFYSVYAVSAGDCLAAVAVQPHGTKTITAVDHTTDTFTSASHGLANGTLVQFYCAPDDILPAGLLDTYDTYNPQGYYYIVNTATNTFQVSLTSGGTALNITSNGTLTFFAVSPGLYSSQLMIHAGLASTGVAWRTTSGSISRANQFVLPVKLYMTAPSLFFIGDSLTMGAQNNTDYVNNPSTGTLDLNTIRFNNPTISYGAVTSAALGLTYQQAGIGGNTSAQMAARFAADVVANHPRAVFIMAGANDAGQDVSQSTYLANMVTMLDAAVAAGIIPFVVLPFGATAINNTRMALMDTYCTGIIALQSSYPTMKIIDPRSLIGEERTTGSPTPPAGNFWNLKTIYDSGDFTHLNDAGYAVLGAYAASQVPSKLAEGAKGAIFTATRSASAPATYIDSGGVIQLTTTSHVPRFTNGFYTTTGFNARKGLLLEKAATNLLIRTNGAAYAANVWTGWTVNGSVTGTSSSSNVLCPELSSITSAASQRIQAAASGGSGSYYMTSSFSAASSIAKDADYVLSFWARSQTANVGLTGLLVVQAQVWDNGLTGFHNFISTTTITQANLTTAWNRYFYTFNVTAINDVGGDGLATVGVARVAVIGLSSGFTVGKVMDLEVYGVQLEAGKYPTSFIPTTTVALTRGAESLTYMLKSTNNRTALTETVFAKFTPFFSANELAADAVLVSTNTKDRRTEINTDGTFSSYGNITDTVGSVATSSGTVVRGTSVFYAVANQTTGNPNVASYINGSVDGSTNTDFTLPAWTPPDTGAGYFHVAADNAGANIPSSIIESIGVYDSAFGASAMSNLKTVMV